MLTSADIGNHAVRPKNGRLFPLILIPDHVRGFCATSLSTYDFPTLDTTLPYNLIKERLNDLIEWSFEKEDLPYLACNEKKTRSILLNPKIDINFGRVKICVKP